MKKYLVLELQGRGEIESVEFIEDIGKFIEEKKNELETDEFFNIGEYDWGFDLVLYEEWSYLCFDIESDLVKDFSKKVGVDVNELDRFEEIEELLELIF